MSRLCLFALALSIALTAAMPSHAAEKPEGQPIKEIMRMPWAPAEEPYMRDWLICGEFPNPPHEGDEFYDHTPPYTGVDTDYLAEHGGETGIRPVAGMMHVRPDGTEAKWFEYSATKDVISLHAVLEGRPRDNVLAYAYATINSDEEREATLSLGSDDGVRVWLNGEVVHNNIVGRGTLKDQDAVPITLRKGDNALLLKIEQGMGEFGFAARIVEKTEALARESGRFFSRIEASPEGAPLLLVINTDPLWNLQRIEPLLTEVVAPGGEVIASAKSNRGETVSFNASDWKTGPLDIVVSSLMPNQPGEPRRMPCRMPWYKGDVLEQLTELLDMCDTLSEDSNDPDILRYGVIGRLVVDRLGGDPRDVDFDHSPIAPDSSIHGEVHNVLVEHREIQMGDAAALRARGAYRLAWRDCGSRLIHPGNNAYVFPQI